MNASYAKTDRKFLLVLILAIFSLTLEAQNIEKLAEIRNDFLMKRDSAKRIIKKLKSAQSPTAKDIEYDKIEYFEYNTPVIYKPHNKKSAGYIEANKVRDDGILGFDLNGSSQIINVWDVGAVYSEHVELEGRIEQKDEAAEFSYHATHLAGTMIAEGIRQEAQGISYKGFIEAYDWGNDLSEMADAASNGIYLSNHSYGTICGWDFNGEDDKWYWYGDPEINNSEDYKFGFYTYESKQFDAIAHAAPHYLLVGSAGNDRNEGPAITVEHYFWGDDGWELSEDERNKDGNEDGFDCLSGKALSKNVLTVGAASPFAGDSDKIIFEVRPNSSSGPSDDGRIKPDIIAPGYQLYSTGSQDINHYSTLSGTSTAAAVTTGSISLIREYYMNNYVDPPLSSTLKAIVLHTAEQINDISGPTYHSGWGMLNVKRAVLLIKQDIDFGKNFLIQEKKLTCGDQISRDILPNKNEPLRVTICWTDPEGPVMEHELNNPELILVNDLDIKLTDNEGNTYLPYILDPQNPADTAGKGDNIRDNVEQVCIRNPTAESYQIIISHKGTLQDNKQMFSLVVSGITDNESSIPETPNLSYPEEGEIIQKYQWIDFSWNYSDSITSYEIQLADDENFTNIIWSEDGIIKSSVNYQAVLENNTRYFWRVKAISKGLYSEWSDIRSLLIENNETSYDNNLTIPVSVFPNPNNGDFYIECNYDIKELKILTLTGSVILYEDNPVSRKFTVNVSPGLYFLQIFLESEMIIYKLVIEK